MQQLISQVEKLSGSLETEQRTRQETEAERGRLAQRLEELTQQLATATAALGHSEEETSRLKAEIVSLMSQAEEGRALAQEVARLRQQLAEAEERGRAQAICLSTP